MGQERLDQLNRMPSASESVSCRMACGGMASSTLDSPSRETSPIAANGITPQAIAANGIAVSMIGRQETVSFHSAVPATLLKAMLRFLQQHPNWDQYRLIQAALAGFLVQNGVQNRGITRCYLANLFPGRSGFQ